MGVTIKMEPLADGQDITPGGRSAFVEALRELFGESYEWTLDPADVPKLEGLRAGFSDDDARKSVSRIIEMLEQKGRLRVWCVF